MLFCLGLGGCLCLRYYCVCCRFRLEVFSIGLWGGFRLKLFRFRGVCFIVGVWDLFELVVWT